MALLLSPEANILQIACVYKCKLDTIQKLVEDDRGLLLREDGNKRIALHEAVQLRLPHEVLHYLLDGIKSLLSEGAQVPSIPGANILHVACAYNCELGIIKKLVKDDPKLLQMTDDEGRIPLHLAVRYGASTNLVRYLVESDYSSVLKEDKLSQFSCRRYMRKLLFGRKVWKGPFVLSLYEYRTLLILSNFFAINSTLIRSITRHIMICREEK